MTTKLTDDQIQEIFLLQLHLQRAFNLDPVHERLLLAEIAAAEQQYQRYQIEKFQI